jgi:hypothetical protein
MRLGLGAICAISLGGCSRDEPQTPPAAEPQPAVSQPAAALAGQPAVAPPPQARSGDTKWIGGIPYDVFYDRPLEIASDQTQLAAAGTDVPTPQVPNASPMPAETPETPENPPPGSESMAAAGGAVDWQKVAPIEQISEEISAVRNDLQQKLNTLATYNNSWEMIGVDATELAALAGVVERHPADVSWKENAKVARELASQINSNAAKTGRTAYDATKAPYDSLVDLLSGNPPPEVEAEDQAPFADFADRSVLMSRMESTLNNLKANINTPEKLAESPAEIKRKLTVLATLASVVSTDSYDYTAEPQYQKFVQTFVNAAVMGRDAVDANNYEGFQSSLGELQKTCNDCHGKYAFGGDEF